MKTDWRNYGAVVKCRRCGRQWRNRREAGPHPECPACRAAARRGARPCAVCGGPMRGQAQRYCSPPCRRKAASVLAAQNYQKKRRPLCVQCRRRCVRDDIRDHSGPSPFCSSHCAIDWACQNAPRPPLTSPG